jgi:hypothetical protein
MGAAAPAIATEKPLSIRGPLRYQVSTSSPQIEAGTKFSIYIRITNPYDVPVIISSVTTLLPVEFMDVAALERAQKKQVLVQELRTLEGVGAEAKRGLFGARKAPPVPSQVAGQPVASVPDVPSYISDNEVRNILSSIDNAQDKDAAKAKAIDQLREALNNVETAATPPTALQPGNSIIQVFTLQTNRSIFFPPNVYQSSVRIEYEIDSKKNIDVADYQLNVRAPLKAMIFGALVGSAFGFVLKDLINNQVITKVLQYGLHSQVGLSYLLSLISAMMIAGIAVVAFARKKDAQPILSVEDFWGGIFVGFLAGYTGKSFLDQALVKAPA